MGINLKILIILDSVAYKNKESRLIEGLSNICKPDFFYTYYENKIVVFFHKMPIIGNFFSHLCYWWIAFRDAVMLFSSKKEYETKIFINPIVGIFYCFFIRLFNRRERVIVAGFLFEQKSSKLYFNLRKWFVNYCYKNVYKIIVYSTQETQHYAKWFPSLSLKFFFIKYGKDFDVYNNDAYESEMPYIATGGGSNRDFKTLFKALAVLENKYPELKCKIATRPKALGINNGRKNIDVLYNIRLEKFGSFLASGLFVIIPLANTLLSAGHMVLLEAMYKEKIILIADILSIRDYVDENSVYFYQSEDYIDLAKKIEYLYLNLNKPTVLQKGKAAKDMYELNYNFLSLLKRIVAELE